ncbi:MAG: tetratricopeptide repeat protein [bacterium]|nr:tetratricopeptide repeat protein [bacterium]
MRADRAYRVELLIRALAFCLVLILGLSVAVTPTWAEDVERYIEEGLAHYTEGQFDLAIASFQGAIRLKPDFWLPHYSLALAYDKKGQYDAAISSFKEAIRLKPDNASAHEALGITYFHAGNRGKALEEYKILKELDQDKAKKLFDKISKD